MSIVAIRVAVVAKPTIKLRLRHQTSDKLSPMRLEVGLEVSIERSLAASEPSSLLYSTGFPVSQAMLSS